MTAPSHIRKTSVRRWSTEKVDQMCDLVAEDLTFQEVADRMGVTRSAVIARFHRIIEKMGAQAA